MPLAFRYAKARRSLPAPASNERPQLCVATETQAVQRPERDQPVSAADAEKRVVGLELGAVQQRSRTGSPRPSPGCPIL